MANPEHLEILKQGVEVWNQWRTENPEIEPDLCEAICSQANLPGANLTVTDLSKANLDRSDLRGAVLRGSNLTSATIRRAYLRRADLCRATLREANLYDTDFTGANCTGANLSGADLRHARIVGTNLEGANLTGCLVYGISAWRLRLEDAHQSNLIITARDEPTITVDNLQVAQFIHLLLNHAEIRDVIETITSKVVLILGRFTPERKAILDALRDALRRHDLLPVLFDFQKPESRDFTETVATLAHMARFVIADMTEPRIVLEEVPHIVRNIAVPLVPLLLAGEEEPVTLYNLRRNHRSILPTCLYTNRDDLLASLEEQIIDPAQEKLQELLAIR